MLRNSVAFLLMLSLAWTACAQVPAKSAPVEAEGDNSSAPAATLELQKRRAELRALLKSQQVHSNQIDPRRLTPNERGLLRQQLIEQQLLEQQLQAQQSPQSQPSQPSQPSQHSQILVPVQLPVSAQHAPASQPH